MSKRSIPQKIAAAVSGGVDSAVAAALLKGQGHTVIAVYIGCGAEKMACELDQNYQAARQVAKQLNLPFEVFTLHQAFRQKILDYFFQEYREGRTPNPDVRCNQEIKFGIFLEKALSELKVDAVATGHYIRRKFKNGSYRLYRGVDETKDQSYFLYHLNQEQLDKVIFPLGKMTKKEVRQKARQLGLKNWQRPDSQGLCFLNQARLFDFLRRQLPVKKGLVVNTTGEGIGRHQGAWFYTIGQRHGFSIQKYQGKPLYVVSKNMKTNELIVGSREEASQSSFEVTDLSWVTGRAYQGKCTIRIRHLGELVEATIKNKSRPDDIGAAPVYKSDPEIRPRESKADNRSAVDLDTITIGLSRPVFGVAPGQSAVFYLDDEVLGGGIISYSLTSEEPIIIPRHIPKKSIPCCEVNQ